MDRLEHALNGLTLSVNQTPVFPVDTPRLIRGGRIYPVASPNAIRSVAGLLRDCIFRDIPASQPDDPPCAELRNRLHHASELLYGGRRCYGLDASRTLASIAFELYEAVNVSNEQLADALKAKLGKDAQEVMEWLWNKIDASQGIADDVATELEIRTATTADLYAKGLVSFSRFKFSLKYILERASTPELYVIFMRCFIMRGLTETAPKLPVDRWVPIRERWFAIERNFDTSEYKVMNNILYAFGEDAQVDGQAWCGLPSCEEVEYGEMEDICDRMEWDVKGYLDAVSDGGEDGDVVCTAMGGMSL